VKAYWFCCGFGSFAGSATNRPFILDQKPWCLVPGFLPVLPASGACEGDLPFASAFGLDAPFIGGPPSTCPVKSHSGSTRDSRISSIDRGSGSGGGWGDSDEKVSGGIITFQVGASSGLGVDSAFLGGATGWLSLALSGMLNSIAVCAVSGGAGCVCGSTVVAELGVIGVSGAGWCERGLGVAGVAADVAPPPAAPGTGGYGRVFGMGATAAMAFGGGTAVVSDALGAVTVAAVVFAATAGGLFSGAAAGGGVESAGCAKPVSCSSGARAAKATIAASQSQLPTFPGTGFKLLAVMKNSQPSGTIIC